MLPISYNTAKRWGHNTSRNPVVENMPKQVQFPTTEWLARSTVTKSVLDCGIEFLPTWLKPIFRDVGVDGDAQVAVILIVVMFEDQAF